MDRKALLFGAPYGSLRAVHASLARLACALWRHGFRSVRIFPEAPREQLLGELDAWIDAVQPGDAAVLVYVGHGGWRDGVGYLEPCGYPDSSAREFRGVLALEFGARLVRLAQRTRNVTVVLDCCHAVGVVADPTHLDEQTRERVLEGQRNKLGRRDGFETITRGGGSPLDHVVVLAAAATPQIATEDHERRIGRFSGELAAVLEYCVDREVAWYEVMDAVRDGVRADYPEQFPVLQGPERVVPFTGRDSGASRRSIGCRRLGEGLGMDVGEIHGVAAGERFQVQALGHAPTADAPLAEVTEVGLQHAVLTLVGPATLPPKDVPLRVTRLRGGDVARPGAARLAIEHILPPDAYEVRWGRVDERGEPCERLADAGAALGRDEDVWLALGVRANVQAAVLYFAVLHIDPQGRRTSLCPRHPAGLALHTREHRLLASRLAREPALEDRLAWPRGLQPGTHELLVLVSADPIDVAALDRRGLETVRGDRPEPLHAVHRATFAVAGTRARVMR